MDKKFITKNAHETKNLGFTFAKSLKPGEAVFLYGDLGAGKTTFVQGVAEGLGLNSRIISPTFIIVRTYETKNDRIKKLNHVDLYRVEKQSEIESLGLDEVVGEENSVSLIEWADRLSNFKFQTGYKIWFEYVDEDRRKITIKKLT